MLIQTGVTVGLLGLLLGFLRWLGIALLQPQARRACPTRIPSEVNGASPGPATAPPSTAGSTSSCPQPEARRVWAIRPASGRAGRQLLRPLRVHRPFNTAFFCSIAAALRALTSSVVSATVAASPAAFALEVGCEVTQPRERFAVLVPFDCALLSITSRIEHTRKPSISRARRRRVPNRVFLHEQVRVLCRVRKSLQDGGHLSQEQGTRRRSWRARLAGAPRSFGLTAAIVLARASVPVPPAWDRYPSHIGSSRCTIAGTLPSSRTRGTARRRGRACRFGRTSPSAVSAASSWRPRSREMLRVDAHLRGPVRRPPRPPGSIVA